MANKTDQNKEVKKTSKAPYVIVASLLVIVAIVVVVALMNSNGSMTGNVINSNNEQNCKDVQVPYNDTEYYSDKEPYTDQECNPLDWVYKIDLTTNTAKCIQQECTAYAQVCSEKNFWGNCVEWKNGDCENYKCVKYQKDCGITVTNQEKEQLYLNMNLQKYDFDTKERTTVTNRDIYVSPLDKNEVRWEYTYLPTDSVGCVYEPKNYPTRQECRDVIKYKDVQKTKIVTRYRTETKCE